MELVGCLPAKRQTARNASTANWVRNICPTRGFVAAELGLETGSRKKSRTA